MVFAAFVIPSFLSSQNPAGRGGRPPFLRLVLPEVSFCSQGVVSLHSRLMNAQDGRLDRREISGHSVGFLCLEIVFESALYV